MMNIKTGSCVISAAHGRGVVVEYNGNLTLPYLVEFEQEERPLHRGNGRSSRRYKGNRYWWWDGVDSDGIIPTGEVKIVDANNEDLVMDHKIYFVVFQDSDGDFHLFSGLDFSSGFYKLEDAEKEAEALILGSKNEPDFDPEENNVFVAQIIRYADIETNVSFSSV